jgi:transcriptional regulator with XRE-family HTH domain
MKNWRIAQMKRKNQVGFRLKYLRKSLNLTQTELSSHLGVSASFLSAVENGKEELSEKLRVILYQKYDLPDNYFDEDNVNAFHETKYTWANVKKVLLSTPPRIASINNGIDIPGSIKNFLVNYLDCTYPFLFGKEDEEYAPQGKEKQSGGVPMEIIDILDSTAHDDEYSNIQIRISKIMIYHYKNAKYSKNELIDKCKIAESKVSFLYDNKPSVDRTRNNGFNLSDTVRIWRGLGLTLEYLLTGKN